MTNDSILVVTTTLSEAFRLLTSWIIPGTNFTPAQWFFGIAVFVFAIKFISKAIGAYDKVELYQNKGVPRWGREK